MGLWEVVFRRKELKRLRIENAHLVEYNKQLSNQVRLKELEARALRKEVGR